MASSAIGVVLGRGGTEEALPVAGGPADARSANGEGMGTLAETLSVVSALGAASGSAEPRAPAAEASVGGAECGELSDCGGGKLSRGGAGRLLAAAPRTSGGGVAEVRPVREGGGGGKLRGRGTAELTAPLASGAGVWTEGRGGVLTVGAG